MDARLGTGRRPRLARPAHTSLPMPLLACPPHPGPRAFRHPSSACPALSYPPMGPGADIWCTLETDPQDMGYEIAWRSARSPVPSVWLGRPRLAVITAAALAAWHNPPRRAAHHQLTPRAPSRLLFLFLPGLLFCTTGLVRAAEQFLPAPPPSPLPSSAPQVTPWPWPLCEGSAPPVFTTDAPPETNTSHGQRPKDADDGDDPSLPTHPRPQNTFPPSPRPIPRQQSASAVRCMRLPNLFRVLQGDGGESGVAFLPFTLLCCPASPAEMGM